VTVWHKEGHRVTLKAGQVVQVDCAELRINATSQVVINSPLVTAPVIHAADSLQIDGKELNGHVHRFGTGPGGNTGDQL